jgi:hypothetical protein
MKKRQRLKRSHQVVTRRVDFVADRVDVVAGNNTRAGPRALQSEVQPTYAAVELDGTQSLAHKGTGVRTA